MAHDQPTYASVPGIRVFGMMCVKPNEPAPNPNYAARPSTSPQKQSPVQYVPPSQSSYYQRLQKLTLNKLQGQHKSSERPLDTSDFTTRGISVGSAAASAAMVDGPENREEPFDDTTDDDTGSSTYETASSSMGTTTTPFMTTDTMSTDTTAAAAATTLSGSSSRSSDTSSSIGISSDGGTFTTNSISRNRRATDDSQSDLDQLFSQPLTSNRNSRSADDWPNIPWHEISQQIRDIQWE